MADYANRRVQPLTLKAYIEEALRRSRHLLSEPDGPPYAGALEWGKAKYLQELGVLGERRQVPGSEYYGWGDKRPTGVYPIDTNKAKHYTDRLSQLHIKRARLRWPQGHRGLHISGIRISVTPEEVLEEFPYPSND